MPRKTLSLLLIAMLALSLVGCKANAPEEKPTGETEQPPASAEGKLTAATLPSEPGYAWDVARYFGEPIPVSLTVAGPWTLSAAEGWTVTTTQIVDPADVPELDTFPEYDFVVRTQEFGEDAYFPRQMTDEWLEQLGRIPIAGGAEAYENPLKLWPLNFSVGDTFVVAEGGSFKVDATVLAQNTVTVPAGEIPDAYLLRYDYTPLAEGAIEGTQYYILAPEVGFVALFSVAAGDEQTGFTALDSVSLLMTMPQKR